MKKIFALTIAIGALIGSVSAQTPQGGSYPPYTNPNTVPPVNSATGSTINWGYYNLPAPASTHDTIRLVTTSRYTKIWVDSLVGSPVILADTTGDTASYYNVLHNIAGHTKVWIKNNPFQSTFDGDEVTFNFNGSKVAYRKISLPWLFVCPGDTLHVPKKSGNAGGLKATFTYSYQLNTWILQGSSTW